MRKAKRRVTGLVILGMASMTGQALALGIAAGDVLVYQARNDVIGPTNAAMVSILDINPLTPALVQGFAISTQAAPLYSTTADPIANLSLSNNGKLLSFPGWTSAGITGLLGMTPSIPRGVGTLGSDGTYSQPAVYHPGSSGAPDQPHAAYSPDGVNWYFGDTNGMYYNGGTTPLTNSDATLAIKGFSGNTYALHTLSSGFVPPTGNDVGPGSLGTALSQVAPTTPGPAVTSVTYTPLVTLPAGAHDFALASSFNQAADTLYVTTNTGISKFGLVSGVWTAEGSDTLNGATGIAVREVKGMGVEIFVSVDTGVLPTVVGTLDEIIDTAGPSATIAPSAPVVLYTAVALGALDGVSLAPVPEPTSGGLLALGVLALVWRRRQAC